MFYSACSTVPANDVPATGTGPEELQAMCFKNLPIEFDANGKAKLKEGLEDPWAVRREPDRYAELRALEGDAGAARDGRRRAVTRVAGFHGLHMLVDHRADSR